MSIHDERLRRFCAAGLYFVTSQSLSEGRTTIDIVRRALEGGVTLIQLREKDLPLQEYLELARAVRDLTRPYGCLLIINDRIDVALAVDADGVHLGLDDFPIAAARAIAPDLIVGAGLMGGSMVLSLEQLVIDAEVFRMAKQAHRGISTCDEMWLDNVIQRVGPGGNFLGEKSTAVSMRSGEWLIPKLGFHKTQKAWENSGKRDILDEAREKVDQILKNNKPLPLADEIQDELNWIYKKAQEEAG